MDGKIISHYLFQGLRELRLVGRGKAILFVIARHAVMKNWSQLPVGLYEERSCIFSFPDVWLIEAWRFA